MQSVELTPELYSKIQGPYNRRNVYGAAISYGPALQTNDLSKEMFFNVSRYAFCNNAPLLKELGFDTNNITLPIKLRVEPKVGTHPDQSLKLEYLENCNK